MVNRLATLETVCAEKYRKLADRYRQKKSNCRYPAISHRLQIHNEYRMNLIQRALLFLNNGHRPAMFPDDDDVIPVDAPVDAPAVVDPPAAAHLIEDQVEG